MNYKDLTQLTKTIDSMSKDDHIQILSILKNNNVEITENNNGCFIDLTSTPQNVIEEIKKYIDYVEKKKKELSEIECKKEDLKKHIKSSSEV